MSIERQAESTRATSYHRKDKDIKSQRCYITVAHPDCFK